MPCRTVYLPGFALDGMHAYKEWQSYLQDTSAEAKFTETGALWMLGYDRKQNDAMVERLDKFGVKGDVLDADAMKVHTHSTCTQTRARTRARARTHENTHTHTHARAHAHAHARTHARTHRR